MTDGSNKHVGTFTQNVLKLIPTSQYRIVSHNFSSNVIQDSEYIVTSTSGERDCCARSGWRMRKGQKRDRQEQESVRWWKTAALSSEGRGAADFVEMAMASRSVSEDSRKGPVARGAAEYLIYFLYYICPIIVQYIKQYFYRQLYLN